MALGIEDDLGSEDEIVAQGLGVRLGRDAPWRSGSWRGEKWEQSSTSVLEMHIAAHKPRKARTFLYFSFPLIRT